MKTKTPRTKPLIIASTAALLGGLTRATVSIQNNLNNTVQTIGSVIFTANPQDFTEQAQKVKLNPDSNNQVQIQGQVLATHDGLLNKDKNILGASAINSQLYYGQKNILEGSDSAILYGKENEVYGSQNAVIGGHKSIIGELEKNSFSKNDFILGGYFNKINGQKSVIIGGNKNNIKGNKNLILAGKQKKVVGDQNYPFGSYIAIENQDNNFVWSDAKERDENTLISPATSNSFFIRSANGVGVNTTDPVGQGVTVAGMVQLGEDQNLTCNANTLGAMRINGTCFQACERIGNKVMWRHISKTAECGYTPSTAGNQGENNPTPNQPTPQPQPQPVNGQCGSEKNACVVGRLKEETDTSTHFKWKCLGENGGNDSPVCQKVKPQTPSQSCQIWLSGGNIRGDSIEIGEEGLDYHNNNAHYQIRKNLEGQTRLSLQSHWEFTSNNNYSSHGGKLLLYRWKNWNPVPTLGLHIEPEWQGAYTIKLENIVDGVARCEKTYTVRKGQETTPKTQSYWYLKEMPNWTLDDRDFDINSQKDVLFLSGENGRIFDNPNINEEGYRGPHNSSLDYLRDKSILKILQDYLNKDASQDQWERPTGGLASQFDSQGGYAQCSLRRYYGRDFDQGCSMLKPDYSDKKGIVFGNCSEPGKMLEIPIMLRKFEWMQGERGYGYKAVNIRDQWSTVKFECKEVSQ